MDKDKFCEIAETYKDTVYRVALNFYGNPYDADDTVQDVFMKLYMTKQSFQSMEHLRNWLIRVTINDCKNTVTSSWKKRHVALDEISENIPFQEPEQSELFSQVMKLPEKYRTVLYLFYYEDYSVQEIANILEIKDSAVTTRLSRARKKIKVELTKEDSCGYETFI